MFNTSLRKNCGARRRGRRQARQRGADFLPGRLQFVRLATSQKKAGLVRDLGARIKLYKSGSAFHENPPDPAGKEDSP